MNDYCEKQVDEDNAWSLAQVENFVFFFGGIFFNWGVLQILNTKKLPFQSPTLNQKEMLRADSILTNSSQATHYVKEFKKKLVIVGDGECGKTCMN